MKEFYKFFKYNGKIIDIKDFEIKYLDIFSRKVLEMIKEKKIMIGKYIYQKEYQKLLKK